MDHLAFISHVSEEKEIAEALKNHLEQDFEGLDVFVSTVSIRPGQEWVEELKKALGEAQVEIVLCSPESVTQPWLNFEAGAAWIRENIQVIPVCHSGMTPNDLPEPLKSLQGVVATDAEGLSNLYDSVTKALGRQQTPQPTPEFEAIAEEIRNLAGTTKGLRRITRMCQLVGDADLLLHTFLGQERDPIPLKKVAPLSDRTTVFRLWADAEYENSIHATLGESDGVKLIRIRFTNRPGSLPGDVTIRPLGLHAIAVPKEKDWRSLVFDVRAPQSGQGNADRKEPLAIAARIVDAWATQWSYSTRDVRRMFCVPVSDSWRSIALDLRNDDFWVCFKQDGNHHYAAERPDFSVIAAIVIEVGTKATPRPGSGTGELEIARIRLSTKPPAKGGLDRC